MRVVRWSVSAGVSILLLSGLLLALPSDSARGRDIHFRGPIFTISRDTTENPVQLTIGVNNGQVNVTLDSWTEVIIGRGFTADRTRLRLGDFAEVSGFFTASGAIAAQRIHVENRNALEVQGRIQAVNANLIQVRNLDLLIDEASLIRASSGDSAATGGVAQLAVGQEVRARAEEDNGVWRVDELEYGGRTVETEPLRFEGVLLQINGYYLSVDVGVRAGGQSIGVPVARDETTVIEGTLRSGQLVDVEGTFLPGTTMVLARHIVADSNGNDNVFDDSTTDGGPTECELKGAIQSLGPGGLNGQLEFYIQETLVRLNAQTQIRFEDGQAAATTDLADGLEVDIQGAWQAGMVLAREVEIHQNGEAEDDLSGDQSGGDSGSGGNSSGDGETNDGSGSGDVGNTPPGGPTNDGGSDTGEHASATFQISGAISALHRLDDESVDLITVADQSIEINEQTVIERGDSEHPDSSALEVGQSVQIDAVERSDGTIFAKKIEIKD